MITLLFVELLSDKLLITHHFLSVQNFCINEFVAGFNKGSSVFCSPKP